MGLKNLDISKVYYTTRATLIINDLKEILSPNQMLNFKCDFLNTRTFQIRVGRVYSKRFTRHNGVPQGSTIFFRYK